MFIKYTEILTLDYIDIWKVAIVNFILQYNNIFEMSINLWHIQLDGADAAWV